MDGWPEVPESLGLYRRAFIELQTARPPGMNGPSPIPWTAIHQWAQRNAIEDADEFWELHTMVRAQDDAWLDHARDQKQQKSTEDTDEQVDF